MSNASALNPFELVPEGRRTNFAAAHWFAPPQILPLVEVAKGAETERGDHGVHSGPAAGLRQEAGSSGEDVPGYIINRIQFLLNTEVFYLLENGVCTPEQMDMAVKASLMPRGMVLGLVQRYDFTGLDISANNIINGSYVMPEPSKHPAALFDHVDKGELGIKTGKGFYDYAGRSREELCAKRDDLLFRVLQATGDLIDATVAEYIHEKCGNRRRLPYCGGFLWGKPTAAEGRRAGQGGNDRRPGAHRLGARPGG